MTILPLLSGAAQRYTVIGILIFLFASMVIAVCVFAYSIWKQRQYNSTSLPSLDVPVEEDETEVGESAFSLDAIADEEISKGAFTSSFDDEIDFHSLPPLGQVTAEPEEERLPDLMSLAAAQEEEEDQFQAPPESLPSQDLPDTDEVQATSEEDEEWPVPGGEPGVTLDSLPSMPAHAPSYDALPALPEQTYESNGALHSDEVPLASDPAEENWPEAPESAVEEDAPSQTYKEPVAPVGLPAYRADEDAPDWAPVAPAPLAQKPEKRGFRKLRMPTPVDKINEELTENASEDEEVHESSPGRRRRDVPTDSTTF